MFIWRVVVFYFHLKQIQPYISGGWCNDREIVLAKWHIHLNPWKPFFVWHLFPLFCCCPALECYENFKQAMTAIFTATSRFCVLFRSCLETLQGFSEKGKYITARSAFDSPYWSLALLRLWTGGIDRREQQQFHADSDRRRATDLCTCSCQPLWKLFQLPTVADQPLHLFCRQYSSIKPLGLLINWIAKIAQSIFHPYSVY